MLKTDSEEDALVRDLAPLSGLEIGPAMGDRTRARCRALLERRRRRAAGAEVAARVLERLWTRLEPALVSALVVLYLGGTIEKVLQILAR